MWYYFKKHPEDAENVSSTVSPEAIRPSVEQALEVLGEAKTIEIFEMGEWHFVIVATKVTNGSS